MCPTHPLTDFRLFLAEHIGKILLSEASFFKSFVDSVDYEKRQLHAISCVGSHFCSTCFYYATSFHYG